MSATQPKNQPSSENRTRPARTMRAAQMTVFGQALQVKDIPVAKPRADGAIVRVEASGICRSDWHFWNRDLQWMGLTGRNHNLLTTAPLESARE